MAAPPPAAVPTMAKPKDAFEQTTEIPRLVFQVFRTIDLKVKHRVDKKGEKSGVKEIGG